MDKIKILIVEDEFIIAHDLAEIIIENGHEVCAIAKSYEEGIDAISNLNPDLVLLDIQIKGNKDGIQLAEAIQGIYRVPFVFISSHTDQLTLERVKKTNSSGFLVKPFEVDDVRVAIELAFNSYSKSQNHGVENPPGFIINQSLFIRHKNLAVKVKYDSILYCSADANYCTLFTEDQKYVLRSTLKDFENKLDDKRFYRAHKSYLINLDKVSAINSDILIIGNQKIPLGREQQIWLMGHINKI